jgi:hypothetical protein
MSRFNVVPVIIQQMVESIESKSTPANVKFNQIQVLEAVKEYCDRAITEWKKEQEKNNFRKRR